SIWRGSRTKRARSSPRCSPVDGSGRGHFGRGQGPASTRSALPPSHRSITAGLTGSARNSATSWLTGRWSRNAPEPPEHLLRDRRLPEAEEQLSASARRGQVLRPVRVPLRSLKYGSGERGGVPGATIASYPQCNLALDMESSRIPGRISGKFPLSPFSL